LSHFQILGKNRLVASVTVFNVNYTMSGTCTLVIRYICTERYSLSFGTYVLNGIPYHSVHMYWTVFPIIRYICTKRYSLSFGTYVLNGFPYHSVHMYWTVYPIIRYVCTVSKCRFTAIFSLSRFLTHIPSIYTKIFLTNFGIYQTTGCLTHTHNGAIFLLTKLLSSELLKSF